MSPPLLFSDTTESISTFSGGNPASSMISAVRSPLPPAAAIRAYPLMLSTVFSSSGKCSPYHSLTLAPLMLMSRSISSSAPIAWIICRSALSDVCAIFRDDSCTAKSLSLSMASPGFCAKPASTSI